jgi:DNA-binding MarR family transcriptional regulator
MPTTPLNTHEERLWRALQRVLVALPRILEEDLLQQTGLSLTEYSVLMNLSEADGRQLRMADLAQATALSASRMSRVVASLHGRGLVLKQRCDGDGRGYVACLTDEGLARLEGAYPAHLSSARRRVLDQIAPAMTGPLGDFLTGVARNSAKVPLVR